MPDDYLPRTVYTPACSPAEYAKRTPSWQHGKVTNSYRHVNREMLSQAGERTLVNAIIPPGVGSIHAIFTITFESYHALLFYSGLCASIPYDFFIKSAGKGHLNQDVSSLLPLPNKPHITDKIVSRTLRLNCLTTHFAPLWEEQYQPNYAQDTWVLTDQRLSSWLTLTPYWQRDAALRSEFERRQALVEIDVLASMALGLTLDELLTIYRVQFPVLQQNEQRLRFDQRGFVVPVKTISGQFGVDESHPDFPSMVPPFTAVDREADYRHAWAHFEKRLAAEKDATSA
jgi:hypothetical protein